MIEFVVGDTKPDLRFRIKQGNRPATLVPGTTVTFKMKKPNGVIVTVALTQTDAVKQIWAGNFGAGDIDQAAVEAMLCELIVTTPGGGIQHAEGPMKIHVRAEFGAATA